MRAEGSGISDSDTGETKPADFFREPLALQTWQQLP
jgi:hypothetical protein